MSGGKKRIGVLVSGGGTNLQALIDAEGRGELGNGTISLVIASKPDVYALDMSAKDIRRAVDDFSRTISPGYYVEQMSGSGMDGQTLSTLGTVVVIYLLCMLSFMYLMTFLYDSSAYEFNVYEILGATRRRVLAVLGGVMFLLLAVISLVSQVLYAVFYESFFSKLNLFGDFSYSFGDYVAVFSLTLVLVFVFVFAYICVRTSRSTIQNSRKFIS